MSRHARALARARGGVQIGTENFARNAGHALDGDHPIVGDAAPSRHTLRGDAERGGQILLVRKGTEREGETVISSFASHAGKLNDALLSCQWLVDWPMSALCVSVPLKNQGRSMDGLPKRIKQAREGAKLTQKQLADAFGYKPQTVSGWERTEENNTKPNNPNPQTLAKIAAITGVSLKWLITGVEDLIPNVTVPHSDQAAGRVVPSVEWDNVQAFVGGDTSTSEGLVRSHYDCGPNSFRTFAKDKANYPDIEPGDSLIIDPDLGPIAGDYCLVVVRDELLLRRYRPRREHIELVPFNDDFETLLIAHAEVGIVGTMTERVKPRRV